MRILITGVPGTGKTTIAKELSNELKIPLYDIKKFTKAKDVDIASLKRKTEKELKGKKDWILEGHIFCEYKTNANFVFLFDTSETKLREIYKKRKYLPVKIEENIFCKNINYFEKKLGKFYKKIYTLETEKDIKKNICKIKKILQKELVVNKNSQ
ncbi:MAG: AAA family ATPase [Candidatus ainarchaeum sp.]|nr:AAA family ATPase [Candidatus ainarchaeum sp.]